MQIDPTVSSTIKTSPTEPTAEFWNHHNSIQPTMTLNTWNNPTSTQHMVDSWNNQTTIFLPTNDDIEWNAQMCQQYAVEQSHLGVEGQQVEIDELSINESSIGDMVDYTSYYLPPTTYPVLGDYLAQAWSNGKNYSQEEQTYNIDNEGGCINYEEEFMLNGWQNNLDNEEKCNLSNGENDVLNGEIDDMSNPVSFDIQESEKCLLNEDSSNPLGVSDGKIGRVKGDMVVNYLRMMKSDK